MRKNLLSSIFLLLAIAATLPTIGQGVTTSAMNGFITDAQGEILPGALVTAVHEPSGTKYSAVTSAKGLFNIQGMRVGGPYTVSVSFVGFQDYKIENISLQLGQTYPVKAQLSDESIELQAVEIGGSYDVDLSADKTGATTNISTEQIASLPTISRSAQDYYRLTPSASGNSFGGRNNQFNNFSFDGALLNNPFGLDAAVAGGQSAANPISLDAIEQIQVSLSPFDVRQAGFTGAGVNLVTRSGSNDFSGSAFYFFRNENLTGGEVSGEEIVVPDLNVSQYGFRIGGPIIKDKLFFFVNGEFERREDAASNFRAADSQSEASAALGGSLQGVSRVLESDLQRVSSALASSYNYATGPYEDFLLDRESDKILVKLDWNAHPDHTVSLKYNFLNAFRDLTANESAIFNRGPSVNTLQFQNSGYRINNDLNSGVLEVNSRFGGNKFSNRLLAIVQSFRDTRDPFSTPFPQITIFENGSEYIIAGHEPFSVNNELDQDVFQISDNFDIYAGNHVITTGFVFERFKFRNSFNLFNYGSPFTIFPSVDAFIDSTDPTSLNFDPAIDGERRAVQSSGPFFPFANDIIKVGQLGVYVQDEWYAAQNLKLTAGLRVDFPLYFDTEARFQNTDPTFIQQDLINGDTTSAFGNSVYFDEDGNALNVNNANFPESTPLFSPRFGFNYDVNGDQSTIIRGGTGLFTGRLPFVWIANQVTNPFTGFLHTTAEDFDFPQVWKTNIGIDQQLPAEILGSLDFNFSRDVNGVLVRNSALGTPTGTLNTSFDRRSVYNPSDVLVSPGSGFGIANVYLFDNETKGYQLNISLQLKKVFAGGVFTTFGYNFTESKDLNSIPAEISADAFNLNPISGNANQPSVSFSQFGNRHRFIGSLSKKWTYANDKLGTTISTFIEVAEGSRFSYTYFGDLNGDGSNTNDLLYVPTVADLNQMVFSGTDAEQAAQRSAFDNYIRQDDYLNDNRGSVTEANGGIRPWYTIWDVRLLQDLYFLTGNGKKNTVQFSFDILNFANLLNSDWGVRQLNTSGVEFERPVGATIGADGTPVYTFDTTRANTFNDDLGLTSRWQIQFGLRYIFN